MVTPTHTYTRTHAHTSLPPTQAFQKLSQPYRLQHVLWTIKTVHKGRTTLHQLSPQFINAKPQNKAKIYKAFFWKPYGEWTWVKSLNILLNESHWCITFKSQGEGKSVILVNFIMQGDQITFQEQPAKHERLPEHNEHSKTVDWKASSIGPRDLYKIVSTLLNYRVGKKNKPSPN